MVKHGVKLYGLKPEMAVCYSIVQGIFMTNGVGCVITSALDGEHGDLSLHPDGYALDFRSKHITSVARKKAITERLKEALIGYDVVLEDLGGDNEHWHIEFDPKYDALWMEFKENR